MGIKYSKNKNKNKNFNYQLHLNINSSEILVKTDFIKKVFNDGTRFYYFNLPYQKERNIITVKCNFINFQVNKRDDSIITINNGKPIIINNKKYLEYSKLGTAGLFTLRFNDNQRTIILIYREYN
jgi:hypothetical protein